MASRYCRGLVVALLAWIGAPCSGEELRLVPTPPPQVAETAPQTSPPTEVAAPLAFDAFLNMADRGLSEPPPAFAPTRPLLERLPPLPVVAPVNFLDANDGVKWDDTPLDSLLNLGGDQRTAQSQPAAPKEKKW